MFGNAVLELTIKLRSSVALLNNFYIAHGNCARLNEALKQMLKFRKGHLLRLKMGLAVEILRVV